MLILIAYLIEKKKQQLEEPAQVEMNQYLLEYQAVKSGVLEVDLIYLYWNLL